MTNRKTTRNPKTSRSTGGRDNRGRTSQNDIDIDRDKLQDEQDPYEAGAAPAAATRAERVFAKRRASVTPQGKSDQDSALSETELQRGQVVVDGEAFNIREGDLLLGPDELEVYELEQQIRYAQYELLARSGLTEGLVTPGGAGTSALVAIAQAGQIVRWAPGVVLSYCVLRQTFPAQQQYQLVVDNMLKATQDWMDTCGVEFQYVPDLDSSTSMRPDGVVFPVRHINANGSFIASAFFPTDMKSRWRVLIDPSYFTTSFDKVGVLRHELGHTLGYRHEHIRSGAPAVCPDESTTDTIDVTAYDPQSCMHYFCGGVGSRSLAITEVDRTGSQLVYGPPLGDFVLLEP
jgi:hypothetical protein